MESFTDTADLNDIQLSDRFEMLERIVVPLWHSNGNTEHPHIFKIFGFGLLIHIYAELRDLPLSLRVMDTHSTRILNEMDAAGTVAVDAMCQAIPELMLWVFFLGGRAARPDGRGKAVFARRMAEILAALGVQSKRGVEEAAARFLNPKSTDIVDWEQVDRLIS